MNKKLYTEIFDSSPIGFSLNKIICDQLNTPIDYEVIYVNESFEINTGLKKKNIVSKNMSTVNIDTNPDETSLIKLYGSVSLNNENYEFMQYFPTLDKWYKVVLYSPQKYYFIKILVDVTNEAKDFEAILERKNDELEQFFSINLDLLCIADLDGNFIKLNKSWETILGYSKEDLKGKTIWDFIHPEDLQSTIEAVSQLKENKAVYNFVNRYKDVYGNYHFIEWRSQPYKKYIYAAARDITERKAAEEKIFLEKEVFRTTLFAVGDGVISVDKKLNIVLMNSVAEKITGWMQSDVKGLSVETIFNIVDENTLEHIDGLVSSVINDMEMVRSSKMSNNMALIKHDSSFISVEFNISPIKNKSDEIEGAVIILRDVSEKRKVQKQVEFFSFHDYLTGLYNRRYFEEELLRLDIKRNLPLALIMLDVNGLKLTNDAFGHEMGDLLLKRVGEILKRHCRADDIIARLGGDEFAIILPKTDDIETRLIMKRIIEASFKENLNSIMVSVAIGHSIKISPIQDINDIMRIAENNMYKNKIKTGKLMRKKTFELIIDTLNSRYSNEQIHNNSVSDLCIKLGEALDFSKEQLDSLSNAALYHDIGKIIIPPEVLNKPFSLSSEERELVQRHPETGYQILKSIEEYSHLARYVLSHHEHWDGNGYPRRQKGSEIPIFSRIICIADAYEAMTNERPYKKILSQAEAVKELREKSGTQFDPNLIETFITKVLKVSH